MDSREKVPAAHQDRIHNVLMGHEDRRHKELVGHQGVQQKLPAGGRGASLGVREEQSLRPPSWLRSFCPWRVQYRVQSTEYRVQIRGKKKTDSGEHVFMTPEFPDEKNMLFCVLC